MKLGLGSYCFMWAHGVEGQRPAQPMSALRLVERCVELGVRVVQVGPNLLLSEAEWRELGARAAAAGLEVEVGIVGLAREEVRLGVERCHAVGATLLRTVDRYQGVARTGQDLRAKLLEALPLLERAGVRLALENALTPARLLARVLDEFQSPLLGVTLDTVNSLAIPEGPAEVVEALARHTLCLHVKDFRVLRVWHAMGFTVEGAVAGEGQLDVPWLLTQLRAAGRDPNAILELWVPQQATLEETIALEARWVERSVERLREWIAE